MDQEQRHIPPTILTIFGITGDLARKKLLPALYALSANNRLPEQFLIVGFARRAWSDNILRNETRKVLKAENIEMEESAWQTFSTRLRYIQSDFDNRAGYDRLKQLIDDCNLECITKLFYFATPPSAFATIIGQMKQAMLNEGCQTHNRTCARVIIEKPFGHDLSSARNLNKLFLDTFTEKQMYRIDHYLGKETVQNILAFRFANAIFEPLWNKDYIDHIQITAAETIGIESRGAFYEETGALRDFFQNHLLQLLAAVACEKPKNLSAESIRYERVKTLQSIKPIKAVSHDTIRGQYKTYRTESNVHEESAVETFVAAKVYIESDRFAGVPFYLRTGKALAEKVTDITIQFKPEHETLFPHKQDDGIPNTLSIRIQPNEGISLRLFTKQLGTGLSVIPSQMDFCYKIVFGSPGDDAYARLLLDVMAGDQTLFTATEEVEASWQFVTPILEAWQTEPQLVYEYEPGSWGPKQSDTLITRDNRTWLAQQVIVCKI